MPAPPPPSACARPSRRWPRRSNVARPTSPTRWRGDAAAHHRVGVRRCRRGIRGAAGRAIRRAGIRWAQVAVERVSRSARRWELVDDEGARWHADAVVLAVPAPRLPALIEDVALRSAAAARRIEVASTALVARPCPAARRCRSTPAYWSPAENVCAPRRSRCRHANGGSAAMSSWCGCRLADSATTSPAVPATRICRRGRRRTWLRSSASPSSPSIVMKRPVDRRCRERSRARRPCGRGAGGLPARLAVAGGYLDGIGVPACVATATRAAGSRRVGRGTIEPWPSSTSSPQRHHSLPDVLGVQRASGGAGEERDAMSTRPRPSRSRRTRAWWSAGSTT